MSLRALFSDVDHLLHSRDPAGRPATTSGRLLALLAAGLLLGVLYGACMGLYALLAPRPESYGTAVRLAQFAATTLKVPVVVLLTYLICAPSLYVFATLAGSRARPQEIVDVILCTAAPGHAPSPHLRPRATLTSACRTSRPTGGS